LLLIRGEEATLSYDELLEEWHGREQRPFHDFMTLNDNGLFLGASTELAKFEGNGGELPKLDIDGRAEKILTLLSIAYWRPIELDTLEHLRRASNAYTRGDKVLAHIHLAHSGLPKFDDSDQACRLFVADRLLSTGVSPITLLESLDIDATTIRLVKASPADLKHPGWPAGAPNRQGGQFRPKDGDLDGFDPPIIPAADFSGGFHDAVIDAWMDFFREKGIPALAAPAIRVVGPNSRVVGYPDIIIQGPGPGWTVFEIKTGNDPTFTGPQAAYLPALQVGGHIYSNEPEIGKLGLTPGVPFPPMRVMIVYAPGPNQPYKYIPLPPPVFEH